MNDLKFAIRQLLKNPGFTATAVFTLALCIGANLVIFAVVDGVLLRPLPFPEPERLVTIYHDYPKSDLGRTGSSIPDLYNRRGRIDAFASLGACMSDAVIVGEPGPEAARKSCASRPISSRRSVSGSRRDACSPRMK